MSGDEAAASAEPQRKGLSGLFHRVAVFLREVRGELRRVHWPTQRQIINYSSVVLVAVIILTAYVFVLDSIFSQLVLWVFG